jgi:hypothetical protein
LLEVSAICAAGLMTSLESYTRHGVALQSEHTNAGALDIATESR